MPVDPSKLLDQQTQGPSAKAWLGFLAVGVVASGILIYLYPQLFPEHQNNIEQISVSEPTGPLSVSADTPINVPAAALELVTTRDTISGISFDHPANWITETTSKLALAKIDSCGSASAAFYPLEFTVENHSASKIIEFFSDAVKAHAVRQSGNVTIGSINDSKTDSASALFSGNICSKNVRGLISSTVNGSQGIVRIYWAPENNFSELESTLNLMIKSYRAPGDGTLLEIQGSKIEIATPDIWNVTDSSQSILATSNSKRVLATYLPIEAPDSLPGIIDTIIQLEKDAGLLISNESTILNEEFSFTDSADLEWSISSRITNFNLEETPTRAIITASTTSQLDKAIIVWRQAAAETFNEDSVQLLAVGNSIKFIEPELSGLIDNKTVKIPILPRNETDSFLGGTDLVKDLAKIAAGKWRPFILGYQKVFAPDNSFLLTPLANTNAVGNFTRVIDGEIQTLTPVDD